MQIVERYSESTPHIDQASGFEWDTSEIYELLKCPACKAISLRRYHWNDHYMESEGDVVFDTLYPSAPKIPDGLPAEIDKAYRAALKVRSIDSNAFGVLIGRVIEMVCLNPGAEGKFLSHKLADLATKGEVPEKLVDVSKNLAQLRNVGAHADLGELTTEEIPVLEDLCRAILDYVYTAPFLAKTAETRLEKLRKRKRTPTSKSREDKRNSAPS